MDELDEKVKPVITNDKAMEVLDKIKTILYHIHLSPSDRIMDIWSLTDNYIEESNAEPEIPNDVFYERY